MDKTPTTEVAFDVQVGMTVLFCLDRPTDAPPTLPPLLVTRTDGAKVDGLLVYWGEADRQTEYCRRYAHFLPAVGGSPAGWVYSVHYGHAIGEWRFLGDHR